MFSDESPHLRVLPSMPVSTFEEAAQALKTLPAPWWLRSRTSGNQLCVELREENELTLAWHKACALMPGVPVYVQPAVSGTCYRVLGAYDGRAFRPTHFLEERMREGFYRIPNACVIPPHTQTGPRRRVLNAAAQMAGRWPGEPGPLCVELIEDGTHTLAAQCNQDGVQGSLSDALRLFLGYTMQADRLDTEDGARSSTLEPGIAAAVCWFDAPTGVVVEIAGLTEARGMEDVLEVVMGIHEGDTVRHVTDTASRDRLGYVVATGENAQAALRTARRAVAAVRIETSPILEPAGED